MRQFLFLFAVLAAGGVGVARYSDHAKSSGTNAMAMAVKPAPVPAVSSNYSTVTLNSDSRGHFQIDARVDGRSIDFLVDTGASSIALRESSAAKLGIHPSARDYSIKMQTANGIGKVAVDLVGACKIPFAPDHIKKFAARSEIGKKRKSPKC